MKFDIKKIMIIAALGIGCNVVAIGWFGRSKKPAETQKISNFPVKARMISFALSDQPGRISAVDVTITYENGGSETLSFDTYNQSRIFSIPAPIKKIKVRYKYAASSTTSEEDISEMYIAEINEAINNPQSEKTKEEDEFVVVGKTKILNLRLRRDMSEMSISSEYSSVQ